MKTRREFPAVPRSVSAARRFAEEVVSATELEVPLDVVALLTSELATNAVVFGQADVFEVEVEVAQPPQGVRVQVVDGNPEPPALSHPLDGDSHGRGLILVNSLASKWGSCVLPGPKKAVWFEI